MRHLLTDLRGNPIWWGSRHLSHRFRNACSSRRYLRNRHPNLPTMFYLVQRQAWPEVIQRCRTHPHECAMAEYGSGNTPLHVACQLDPPPQALRALIDGCRAAGMTSVVNAQGATPLHIAASHRCSAASIRVLLEEDEEDHILGDAEAQVDATAYRSGMARAPIHYACLSFRGLDLQAFSVLLEATLLRGNVVLDRGDKQMDPEDDLFLSCSKSIDEYIDEEDYFLDQQDRRRKTEPKDVSLPSSSNHSSPVIVMNVLTLRDVTGHTPLGLLFRRYRERVRTVIASIDRIHATRSRNAQLASALAVQADLGCLWGKARMLVARLTQDRLQREEQMMNIMAEEDDCCSISKEAASWAMEKYTATYRDRQQVACHDDRPFRIVHASVGLTGYGCPPEMIRLAISMYPGSLSEMDEDGNLPLHIASAATSFMSGSDHIPGLGADDESVMSDGMMSFFSSSSTNASPYAFDKVIQILLRHYPEAACIPQGRTGKLPLALAAQAGHRSWGDGMKTLLHAYPAALHSQRLPLSVYAELLALVNASATAANQERVVRNLGVLVQQARFGTTNNHRTVKASAKRAKAKAGTIIFELIKTKPELVGGKEIKEEI